MDCNFTKKVCSVCKKENEYLQFFPESNLTDFESYMQQNNFMLHKCESCGYVSEDLSAEPQVDFYKIKNSAEYKNAVNYEYLKNYKNDTDGEIISYLYSLPANLYEANFYLNVDNDKKFLSLFMCVINKQNIILNIKDMIECDYDDLPDDDIECFEKTMQLLNMSMQNNISVAIKLYDEVEKNLFNNVRYLELLILKGDLKNAKNLYLQLKDKLSNDFKEHIKMQFAQAAN